MVDDEKYPKTEWAVNLGQTCTEKAYHLQLTLRGAFCVLGACIDASPLALACDCGGNLDVVLCVIGSHSGKLKVIDARAGSFTPQNTAVPKI